MILPINNNVVYDKTEQLLSSEIQKATQRQAAYAYNIANAATPGFKPIRFEDELDKASEAYNDKEYGFNLEVEMGKLSENRLYHATLVRVLSAKVQSLKRVVTLGKGG